MTKIIMRFRFGKYGISTDIEEAFLEATSDVNNTTGIHFILDITKVIESHVVHLSIRRKLPTT